MDRHVGIVGSPGSWITRSVLPTSDLTVAIQLLVLLVLAGLALWWLRDRPEWRLVVLGLTLLLLGGMGLRAAH